MAKQTLNIGTNANDGTGDKLRDAMIKVNENFTEIYTSPGISSDAILISGNEIKAIRSDDDLIFNPAGSGSVSTPALRFNGNNIEGIRSNENINLVPQGTGSVIFGAIKINGTSLSSDDSSTINVNDNLIVDGTTTIEGTALFKSAVTLESTLDVTGNTTLANITASGTAALSGTVTIDNLTFNDNIIASSSNADIRLEPGGTGAVVLTNLTIDSNINITDNIIKTTASNSNLQLSGSGSGTVEVTSGLTTAAITTVGNVGITGTETITGQLDVDYVRIKDNTITTNASNAHLILSGNGSGNVVIDDVDIGGGAIDGTVIGGTTPAAGTFTTITANTSVTIDGVTITDNTVSTNASNANLELTGSGSGGVTISGFTFPTSDGSNGEFLKTDGAGALNAYNSALITNEKKQRNNAASFRGWDCGRLSDVHFDDKMSTFCYRLKVPNNFFLKKLNVRIALAWTSQITSFWGIPLGSNLTVDLDLGEAENTVIDGLQDKGYKVNILYKDFTKVTLIISSEQK